MMQGQRTQKYQQMRQLLNEKQWRQSLALEAQERGTIAEESEHAVPLSSCVLSFSQHHRAATAGILRSRLLSASRRSYSGSPVAS